MDKETRRDIIETVKDIDNTLSIVTIIISLVIGFFVIVLMIGFLYLMSNWDFSF